MFNLNYIFKSNKPEQNIYARTLLNLANDNDFMNSLLEGGVKEITIRFYGIENNGKSFYEKLQDIKAENKPRLEKLLQIALEKEDYKECAKLRDRIDEI